VHLVGFITKKKGSFTVPEEACHDFNCRSVRLELVLPRPPRSPDLAISDCDIFWPPDGCTPRTTFCGRRRTETRRVCSAPTLQQRVSRVRHRVSLWRWKSVLILKETLWKNNLNFVKDLPMTYVDLIRTYCSFWEKKWETLLSYQPALFCFTLQKVVVLAFWHLSKG
jgi:hypothetical protein